MEFYRYFSAMDENDNFVLHFETYVFVKETPCGYWIVQKETPEFIIDKRKRWIPKVSVKRFAYRSKRKALNNYIRRTSKYLEILNHQLDKSVVCLQKATVMYEQKLYNDDRSYED